MPWPWEWRCSPVARKRPRISPAAAAAATGGAHLPTFKDRSIEKAIDEIGGELHSQYTISYTPTGSDATGYHEIKVSVLRNDAKTLKVHARPGYFLAAPES